MIDQIGSGQVRGLTESELRTNYRFVSAFEKLRKSLGFREMSDAALHEAARATGLRFEDLRVARHLRNALAHDEQVNHDTVIRYLAILTGGSEPGAASPDVTAQPGATISGARQESSVAAFRVHAWRDPRLERLMIANGFVSVGGDEIGDLSGVIDPEVIRAAMSESMQDRSPTAINVFLGYWKRFLWEARVGDPVVLPTQTLGVAIGEFAGPYFYVGSAEPRARHRRNVEWIRFNIPRSAFDEDLQRVLSGRHTVQTFKSPDAVQRLRRIAQTGN